MNRDTGTWLEEAGNSSSISRRAELNSSSDHSPDRRGNRSSAHPAKWPSPIIHEETHFEPRFHGFSFGPAPDRVGSEKQHDPDQPDQKRRPAKNVKLRTQMPVASDRPKYRGPRIVVKYQGQISRPNIGSAVSEVDAATSRMSVPENPRLPGSTRGRNPTAAGCPAAVPVPPATGEPAGTGGQRACCRGAAPTLEPSLR